jgi:ADP-ribosylglycohydrolase
MRLTWAQPEDLVAAEVVALREQGADESLLVPVVRRWVEAGGDAELQRSGASPTPASAELRAVARELLDALAALQTGSPDEPDEWADIVSGLEQRRPTEPSRNPPRALADAVAGAWTGRAVGCLLGKPVEKIPREGIRAILQSAGRWPLSDYFTAQGLPDDVAARWPWNRRSAPTSLVENIDGMPEDDDLNFALLALDLLEGHGPGLTTEAVAQAWLDNLPAGRVFTAERAAYRNLLEARPLPETATHHNPFREWIGALIRADVHGWARPGQPLLAARSAWVDARLSHTRNGTYGAMWAAALCALSLTEGSATAVLDGAQAVVPPRSRLAEAVIFGRSLAGRDAEAALDALHERYEGMHWVHTLNNAALIAYALEDGEGDLGRSIALAVMGGWDTDSAGATVGSVVGGLIGAEAIPARWKDPVAGRIATSLPGRVEERIDDLVRRTLALQERMRQGG